MIHLLAANSEVQTTSWFSTLKVSDLIWAFWMSCWRWASAESGSSMKVTFWSGCAAFHSSMLLFAAVAFGVLFASVVPPPQPARATAATVRDAVVARRVCQLRRRCLMCCSLLSDLYGWFGACGTAAAVVLTRGLV